MRRDWEKMPNFEAAFCRRPGERAETGGKMNKEKRTKSRNKSREDERRQY